MAQDIIKGLITFDEQHQHGLYPYTSTDCVFDENGNPLSNYIKPVETLWTNPNPSRSMSATRITIAPSGTPKFLLIECRLYASSSTNYKTSIMIPYVANSNYVLSAPRFDGTNNLIMSRNFIIGYQGDMTQISVGGGCSMNSYGNMGTTNNSAMIPLEIFAIY